jgi:hypothetical protein
MTYSDSIPGVCRAVERVQHVTPVEATKVAIPRINQLDGGSFTIGGSAMQPQRSRVREPGPRQKRNEKRTQNSHVESTPYTITRPNGAHFIEEVLSDIHALAILDDRRMARLGESSAVAVENGTQSQIASRSTSLELDRGSNDTNGCNGKEYCKEISGEQHGC